MIKNRNWTILYILLVVLPVIGILIYASVEPAGLIYRWRWDLGDYGFYYFSFSIAVYGTVYIGYFALLTYTLWYKVVEVGERGKGE